MTRVPSLNWNLTPKQAIELQQQLRYQVNCHDQLSDIKRVAGVDVGFEQQGSITRAAVVILNLADLKPVAHTIYRQPTRFPYVPGLLSFRELPAVLGAFEQLEQWPDLILCDGHGIAHPRRLGIASHLGVLLDMPTIGVGKTRLCGRYSSVPEERGQWTELYDKNETIGAVLRTRQGVKPVYISSGHKISLETAIEYVMACTTGYKLPETTRWAHKLASG